MYMVLPIMRRVVATLLLVLWAFSGWAQGQGPDYEAWHSVANRAERCGERRARVRCGIHRFARRSG